MTVCDQLLLDRLEQRSLGPQNDVDETVVDQVRANWPDGVEAVHSHRLVEALVAYGPLL